MQPDCHLVIYTKTSHLWASDTWRKGTNCMLMFAPGNGCGRKGDLVIIDSRSGAVRWHIPSGVLNPLPSELTMLPSGRAALLQPDGT